MDRRRQMIERHLAASGRGTPPGSPSAEFDVTARDFADLEVRTPLGDGRGYACFYDLRERREVRDFVLDDRPKVATVCSVSLVRDNGAVSPRIKLWKKDKTKVWREAVKPAIPGTDSAVVIKALVDMGDVHENFWKVISFLRCCIGLEIPGSDFRVADGDIARLTQLLAGQERSTLWEVVKNAIGGTLTEADIQLIGNRKVQLRQFQRLLDEPDYFEQEMARTDKAGPEALWQSFFEANHWIFGYGLNLIACQPLDEGRLERITTGANIFSGAGKRSDAVLRSRGLISSMLFCEIKTHRTRLLEKTPYRAPDVYQVSKEVTGGVAQVQKTVSKALRLASEQLHRIYSDDGTPSHIEVSTARPRQVLVIGSLREFVQVTSVNPERITSFEQYRTSLRDVEVITFDELYQRASFIVGDH
jgi:hypothetical protein